MAGTTGTLLELPMYLKRRSDSGEKILTIWRSAQPAAPNATEVGRLNEAPSQLPTEPNLQLEERDVVAKQATAEPSALEAAGARADQPAVALRRAAIPPARERAEMEVPADPEVGDLEPTDTNQFMVHTSSSLKLPGRIESCCRTRDS